MKLYTQRVGQSVYEALKCSVARACGHSSFRPSYRSSQRSVSSRNKTAYTPGGLKRCMQQCRVFMQIAVRGRGLEDGRKMWRDPLRNDPLVVHRCTWEED